MRKAYAYTNSEPVEEKKYLQVNVCEAIPRDDARTEFAWSDLTEHHLFRGNDTMMVLERFFYDGENLEELYQARLDYIAELDVELDIKNIDKMTPSELYKFRDSINYEYDSEMQHNMLSIVIIEYLNDQGYTIEQLDEYDGVLLNITW